MQADLLGRQLNLCVAGSGRLVLELLFQRADFQLRLFQLVGMGLLLALQIVDQQHLLVQLNRLRFQLLAQGCLGLELRTGGLSAGNQLRVHPQRGHVDGQLGDGAGRACQQVVISGAEGRAALAPGNGLIAQPLNVAKGQVDSLAGFNLYQCAFGQHARRLPGLDRFAQAYGG